MTTITFAVQGSAELPYQVSFSKSGETNLTAHCTCPAGVVHQYCKHRLNILMGDVSDIVSANPEQVHTVYDWFKGSDVERTMQAINQLESEMDALKKQLVAAKKAVALAMKD